MYADFFSQFRIFIFLLPNQKPCDFLVFPKRMKLLYSLEDKSTGSF